MLINKTVGAKRGEKIMQMLGDNNNNFALRQHCFALCLVGRYQQGQSASEMNSFWLERDAPGNSVMRTRRHLTFSVAGYRLFQFSAEVE